MKFVADDQPAEPLQPGEQPLHHPAAQIAPQRSAVLSLAPVLQRPALQGIPLFSPSPLAASGARFHKTIANTSITPITAQTIALPRSPANQNPLAALKQRMALVHPLTNAPGLLRIFRIFIEPFYD